MIPWTVLLTTDFPPHLGGIATYLLSVYSGGAMERLTLVAPAWPGCRQLDAAQPYTSYRVKTLQRIAGLRGCSFLLQSYRAARNLLKQNHPVVLHCGHVHAAFVALRLKRRYGTPYLVWTHAVELTDKYLRPLIRRSLWGADLVLTNSDYTKRYIESLGIEPSKILKIRPGADPDRFSPLVNPGRMAASLDVAGRRVLLTVATVSKLQRYKGLDMVIRALPRVLQRLPDVVYVVAGGGQDRPYLERLADELGVRSCVKLIGRVADEDLPALYACCDTFVLCSREVQHARGTLAEGFGIVLLEASSTGKPVIGGLSGGIPDAVVHGITGFLVNPTDPEAIAEAIIRVLTEPGLASRLGANGRDWVVREMNWARARREFQQALGRFSSTPSSHGTVPAHSQESGGLVPSPVS